MFRRGRPSADAVAERAPVALLECRRDWRITWCNEAARVLLGTAAGDDFRDAIAADDHWELASWQHGTHATSGEARYAVRTSQGVAVDVRLADSAGSFVVAVVDTSHLSQSLEAERRRREVDPLTGLPNRFALFDVIDHHRRSMRTSRARPTVFVVDVDRMKQINDAFGHQAGDAVLVAVARRLCDVVGEAGTVGRIGGDDFLICLFDGGVEAAQELAERVMTALAEPVLPGVANAAASIGIAPLSPTADLRLSLNEADTAMYRAKAAGRGTTVVYSPTEGTPVDVRHYDHRIARLQRLAQRDERTGLLRDVVFREDHVRLLDDARRGGVPLSMLLVDVDHFHDFNNRYLYAGGDEALRAVAGCIVASVDEDQPVYRFGGEEFAVLLPDTGPADAASTAERVRAAVHALQMEHAGSSWGVVTVSIGTCTVDPGATTENTASLADRMVNGANRALIEAKADGRNRCASANPQDEPSPPSAR